MDDPIAAVAMTSVEPLSVVELSCPFISSCVDEESDVSGSFDLLQKRGEKLAK